MDIRFDGKVAIVTAGASGIGEAIAEAFVEAGANVVVADVNDEAGRAVAARLGGKAEYIHTDMTRDADVADLVGQVTARHGRLDAMVNVVGNTAGGDRSGIQIHEMTEAMWDGTLAVSLKSTFLGIKHAVTYMKDHGGGAVVNITSTAAFRVAANGTPAYGAAKVGVIHLTRTAAVQYGKYGVRVNAIAPGLTETPAMKAALSEEKRSQMAAGTPIPRLIQPAEQAAAVLWLCSDYAAIITGQTLAVDAGDVAR